jgi:hypothetical protein
VDIDAVYPPGKHITLRCAHKRSRHAVRVATHLFVHPNHPLVIRRDRLVLALPHADDIAAGQLRRKHVLERFANIIGAAGVRIFAARVVVCPPIRTRYPQAKLTDDERVVSTRASARRREWARLTDAPFRRSTPSVCSTFPTASARAAAARDRNRGNHAAS